MKKFNKTLLAINMLLLSTSNSFAATGETGGTSGIKYLAVGVAAVIIVLLLFLGYRLDSKDNRRGAEKRRKEAKKRAKEERYEADKISYQKDNVSANDINEVTAYEEDEDDEEEENSEVEEYEETEEDDDVEYGEEFDTSIIDDIEDDIPEVEETEIASDPLMDELKKIQEEKVETKEKPLIFVEEPEIKEKIEEVEEPKKEEFKEMDFLAQMEENLKKNQEARSARTSKKKKED